VPTTETTLGWANLDDERAGHLDIRTSADPDRDPESMLAEGGEESALDGDGADAGPGDHEDLGRNKQTGHGAPGPVGGRSPTPAVAAHARPAPANLTKEETHLELLGHGLVERCAPTR